MTPEEIRTFSSTTRFHSSDVKEAAELIYEEFGDEDLPKILDECGKAANAMGHHRSITYAVNCLIDAHQRFT